MVDPKAAPLRRRKNPYSLTHAASITAFKAWLTENGAEVLAPTNPYEVVRFRGEQGVSIVYRNDGGRPQRMTGQAGAAWDAYLARQPMRFVRSVPIRAKADPIIRTLQERDGNDCFYCAETFTDALPPTREHLLSRTHGGPDHIANQALACGPCNRLAGHLSLVEKVGLRDRMRAPPV